MLGRHGVRLSNASWRTITHGGGDRTNVIGGCAATAADDVEPAILRPLPKFWGKTFRRFGKTSHRQWIGQSGIRIRARVNRCGAGKLLNVRLHFVRPERAV